MIQQALDIYPQPDVDLWQGDCLDLMPDIQDGSIDMVMADPPYGTTACKWDSIIPLEPMWKQLKRVIKKNGAIVLMASQPFTTTLISSNMEMFKYCWVWEKTQAVGHLNAYKMPLKKTEDIAIFYNRQSIYNYQLKDKPQKDIRPHSRSGGTDNYGKYDDNQAQNRKIPLNKKLPDNVLNFTNAQRTVNPTQKPVALIEYLIKTYTNEQETVLDFCMGSGTTGVACKNLNRNFIGIEKDADYFKIAQDRIAGAI